MDNEIIDISTIKFDSLDSEPISLKSSNFGSGIELLMNDKKEIKLNKDTDINVLNDLESELNSLAGVSSYAPSSNIPSSPFLSSFSDTDSKRVNFSDIGESTGKVKENKTWDGFTKMDNVPVNPDSETSSLPNLSRDELLREKFKYLRKLEALEKKGIELTKKYNMDSPLAEMQGEYEMIMEEKAKQNSVKFQGNMMMAMINGLEFLNNKFDPFDIKLDGWSEQINENITEYDEIFGELYDKYKSRASMAPELKILFQLGGSAMMVHMTNTMFKSSMPGMDDILRQNPDLMRQFQTAAVNSMGQSNPGFSGFMNGIMKDTPPPPMSTQNLHSMQTPASRGGNNFSTRPDISVGRGGVVDDGIHIQERKRPEMKGPSDISDLLSGLKTKTINIKENDNNNSTISISDLKDLEEGNQPKRSKRRAKSDKNTISLDI